MAWRNKKVLALTVLLTAGIAFGSLSLLPASLIGEVDPNLMKAQCPGGEWDSPGSSCHDGVIVDYILPPYPRVSTEESVKAVKKKKKGR